MSRRRYEFDPREHKEVLVPLLAVLVPALTAGDVNQPLPQLELQRILRRFPRQGRGFFSRSELIAGYRALAPMMGLALDPESFAARLRLRPVRTHSGVMPVTVLTKPFPCPGQCVFCPNDVRMPKSYLSDEPGCQRAEQNGFDPYLQTYNRMAALQAIGHQTDKIELIVLGGTWSFYPETYQRWFIKRCFEAMNHFGAGQDGRAQGEEQRFELPARDAKPERPRAADYNRHVERHLRLLGHGATLRNFEAATWQELEAVQAANIAARSRCVGLVLETRPDHITSSEVLRLRRLGCTKVQIGYQSLSDVVLAANKRGHDVAAVRGAMARLRGGGFKVLAHFMPNLLAATPASDIAGFERVFSEPDFRPDEMKVYPCSLVETAELMDSYQAGEWRPYTHDELLEVLCEVIRATPRYCRLSRVIRDICSGDIVVGNRQSNFREVAERALDARGIRRQDIRSREVGSANIAAAALRMKETRYEASDGEEVFIEYVTEEDRIAGFCRLRLPWPASFAEMPAELRGGAVIRELHVYGTAQALGQHVPGRTQHQGLGKRLLGHAAQLARAAGYSSLAVISAVGTRAYYRNQGFVDGVLYQHLPLASTRLSDACSG